MDEKPILERINALAREEHELFERESSGRATEDEINRLRNLQKTLDRCWESLRHWRARREFGQSPDDVRSRGSESTREESSWASGAGKRLTVINAISGRIGIIPRS